MTVHATLEQLEREVTRLTVQEQLRLITHVIEHLRLTLLEGETQQPSDADKLLALCDAAAEMWNGAFDAVQDIRQVRQHRDEQIWPVRS